MKNCNSCDFDFQQRVFTVLAPVSSSSLRLANGVLKAVLQASACSIHSEQDEVGIQSLRFLSRSRSLEPHVVPNILCSVISQVCCDLGKEIVSGDGCIPLKEAQRRDLSED